MRFLHIPGFMHGNGHKRSQVEFITLAQTTLALYQESVEKVSKPLRCKAE